MFSSVPAEILGLVAGWGFLLIVAAFCFPIRSSYQKPIGKGKIVTAAAAKRFRNQSDICRRCRVYRKLGAEIQRTWRNHPLVS